MKHHLPPVLCFVAKMCPCLRVIQPPLTHNLSLLITSRSAGGEERDAGMAPVTKARAPWSLAPRDRPGGIARVRLRGRGRGTTLGDSARARASSERSDEQQHGSARSPLQGDVP